MADIPVSIPAFTTLQNDVDYVQAARHNTVGDEITALATLIGMPGAAQSHLTSFLTLLQLQVRGCEVQYSSTTQINVLAGQIMISNSGGTIRKLRAKTSTSSLTASDLDSGVAFSNSTRHYIYATADTAVTTPVYKISTNASAPSGYTYYRKRGSFLTDSSGNILPESIVTIDNPAVDKVFASARQTITAAGSLTIAHGLGVIPDFVDVRLICTSAEGNYSVGDQVRINPAGNVIGIAADRGVSLVLDSTNINVRFGGNASIFAIPNKTTGSEFAIDPTKWVFFVKAVVI